MTDLNYQMQPDVQKTWYSSVFRVAHFEFQTGENKFHIEGQIYEKGCRDA